MTPYIGQIIQFAGYFAIRGWALCNGQKLPISSYQALYSILGTTYGGDGLTTFALPDLRGRTAIHNGAGLGLSPVSLGQMRAPQLAEAGDGVTTVPTLAVNYLIALEGIYPSRGD